MKVALSQIAPVFLHRVETTKKIVREIRAASLEGCRLVAFGETVLPGYPFWLSLTGGARFNDADQKAMYSYYLQESVSIEGGDLDPICQAAMTGGIAVVLGLVERAVDRGGHSVYCSRVFIDQNGQVLSVHRKLMPTYEERLIWAQGDGHGLVTHPVGPFTVGALNCWENWMPLARSALYALGEDLHVAIWPGSVGLTKDITRFVALESRSFVLSASALLRPEDLPEDLPVHEKLPAKESYFNGGSCIAGPDGKWVVEPVVGREELIVADIDPSRVYEERQNFDPMGHYSRPEIFSLSVDRRRPKAVHWRDESEFGADSC